MINIEQVLEINCLTKAMTGYSKEEFDALLEHFTEAYTVVAKYPVYQRQRRAGGGRKAILRTGKEKLFYILFYCKCHPTFDLLSLLFGFSHSRACDWVHRLLPVIEEALGYEKSLPKNKLKTVGEFKRRFPGVDTMFLRKTVKRLRQTTGEVQENHPSKSNNQSKVIGLFRES